MDWESFYNRFREPDFVPGYEIQNRLGGGAFGEVYKARKHSIGKAYAIKFLKVDDEVQREAIERELDQVRHFAAIDHPNLVTIEDMGTAEGVPYLIMGYAGEDTLARRLRQGPLERETALRFFVQICRGVLALHDRRLVHFDLKPGNVFLKGDIARVGDYGLSKLMTEGCQTLSFGRGTPHYMAPEILRSRADHKADVYSLGVLLFECLAGRVPFDAETPGGLVVRDADAPPEFPDDFPAELRRVVERCLRLDPTRRYDGVQELLEDLGQTARPGDSIVLEALERGEGAARRSPVLARAGAGAGLGAGAGAAVGAGAVAGTREVRQTAAELTRGAVEVARGMWDGFKSASGTPASEQGAEAPASGGRARVNGAAGAGASAAAGGTIPVPPRAEGGFLGAMVTTAVLAVEVLVSLVGGVARGVLRAFGLASHRAKERSRSLVGRLFRLAVFFVLLAVLGAAVMFALVALWGAPMRF